MRTWIKNNRSDILILAIIISLVLLIGLIHIELPGVYFDSAITDYLASLVVHPQMENSETTMSHVGLPVLASVYHGSASMFFQILILNLFEANVITLRLPYLLYYALSTFLVYKIISILSSQKIACIGATLLSVLIYVVTLPRTQYDIMLLGVVFFLLAIYELVAHWSIFQNESYEDADKYSFIIGMYLGLAFYDYFCFILFLPIILFSLLKIQRNNRGWIFLSNVTGVIFGSTLYFVGYADSLLTNIIGQGKLTSILLVIFTLVFLIFIGIPSFYFLYKRDKSKFLRCYFKIGGLCVVVALFGMLVIMLPLIKEKISLNGLNVFGNECSLDERLSKYFVIMMRIGSNSKCEEMINGLHTSIAPTILWSVFLVLQVFYYIWCAKSKTESDKTRLINILNGMFICYYVISLPLIARMQPQHFVPFLFLMPVILFSELGIMLQPGNQKAIKITAFLTLIIICLFNVRDHIVFQNMLSENEGVGAYSVAYDRLASEGVTNSKQGMKEVYLFAEPGFIPSFIYLTDNSVKTDILYDVSGTFSEERIVKIYDYLEQNYHVNIVTRSNMSQITQVLGQYNDNNLATYEYTDSSGSVLFRRLEINKTYKKG